MGKDNGIVVSSSNIQAPDYYYGISPLLETGYYWIGVMAYNFRVGTGLIGRSNLAVPKGPSPVPDGVAQVLFNIGVFVSLDFYFLTVSPECYVYRNDNGQYAFEYTAGPACIISEKE